MDDSGARDGHRILRLLSVNYVKGYRYDKAQIIHMSIDSI